MTNKQEAQYKADQHFKSVFNSIVNKAQKEFKEIVTPKEAVQFKQPKLTKKELKILKEKKEDFDELDEIAKAFLGEPKEVFTTINGKRVKVK